MPYSHIDLSDGYLKERDYTLSLLWAGSAVTKTSYSPLHIPPGPDGGHYLDTSANLLAWGYPNLICRSGSRSGDRRTELGN